MSSVLEPQRSALEELDRIEEAISDRIRFNPSVLPDGSSLSSGSELHGVKKRSYRETVLQEQEIGRFLKRYKEQCEFLDTSFTKMSTLKAKSNNNNNNKGSSKQQNGNDGGDNGLTEELIASHPATLRQKELAAIATSGDARVSVFDKFYQQVHQIKDYHRQYPNQEVEDIKAQYQMGIIGLQEKKSMLESGAFFMSSNIPPSFDAEGNLIPSSENSAQQAAVNALMDAQNRGISVLLSSMATGLDLDTVFSGEEFYGKYLDLISFHERFVNLPFFKPENLDNKHKNGGKETESNDNSTLETLESLRNKTIQPEQLTYLNYLNIFASFSESVYYPTARLRSEQYFTYITEVHKYVEQFMRKTHMLENIGKVILKIENDFDNAWEHKTPFPGWPFNSEDNEATNKGNGHTTNGDAQSQKVEDGVETPQGFYCTPCAKYFAKESVYTNHLTGKKHIKNKKLLDSVSSSSATETSSSNSNKQDVDEALQIRVRLLAFHEYCVYNLSQLLEKQIIATKNNVERRRALTDRERHLELETLDTQDQFMLEEALASLNASHKKSKRGPNGEGGDDEEDDDELVYNPLKLPLGWDGKPIPFWLWKLHGLGVQYPCEICGNHVYMGRKVFEKHFAEVRHIHGLRCLGVVPGTLFNGITSIKDAMALWEKVRRENRLEEGRKENVVEMEDEEGNVMSEKVYNDLKKQGLL